MKDKHVTRTGRDAKYGEFGNPILNLGPLVVAVLDDTVPAEDRRADGTGIRAERDDVLLDANLSGRTYKISVSVESLELIADKFLVRVVPDLDTADSLVEDNLVSTDNSPERGLDSVVRGGCSDSLCRIMSIRCHAGRDQERRSQLISESNLPLAVLHILEEGVLLNLYSYRVVNFLRVADHLLKVFDRVRSAALGRFCVVGEPTCSGSQGRDVRGGNLSGEGHVLNTARVVGVRQRDGAGGLHLADLVRDGADVSILDLGQASKQKLGEIVVDALRRGLVHESSRNLKVLEDDKLLAVIVLSEDKAGFLARNGSLEGVETLGTYRDRLGVKVDIGRHNLYLILCLKHFICEVDLRGIPLLESDFVEVLALAARENLNVISHEGFRRVDAVRGHQGVKSKILVHSSTRLQGLYQGEEPQRRRK